MPTAAPADRQLPALWSLRIDLVTAECVRALDRAGVPALLLKGPTTARWLYRDGTPRGYSDTDLLVPATQVSAALDVLTGLGFVDRRRGWRPEERTPHATALYRGVPGEGDCVDLHHSLALAPGPAPVWDVLSRDAEDTVVAGQRTRMPAEAGRCLVLALHAAQHPGDRTPLEDLRRALATAAPHSWARARSLAAELGAGPAFQVGVLLAGGDATRPAPVAALWADTPLPVRLRVSGAPRGAGTLATVGHRRGLRRLGYAARRAFPSRRFIAEVYGVRGGPALLLGYLRRLAMVARLLPGALRGLRAASTTPAVLGRRPTATGVHPVPARPRRPER